MSVVEGPPPPGTDIYADQRGRIIGSSVAIIVITITSWDDYLTIVALIFSVVGVLIWLIELPNGYGRHIYIWEPEDRIAKGRRWLKGQFVFELFFHTSTSLAKFAVRPIHYIWDRVDENVQGHCFNVNDFFIGSGSANVFLNTVIFLLPLPLLWRLRTTVRQQLILLAIFTLAGLYAWKPQLSLATTADRTSSIVLVSIIWVVVLSRVELPDFTWNYVNAGTWSELEPCMAVVCACIPSLRPLYTIVTQGMFKHPLLAQGTLLCSPSSKKRPWASIKIKSSEGGAFTQLAEPEDLRPLSECAYGASVRVRAARADSAPQQQGEEETIDLPDNRIQVRTEVTLTTSDRVEYNDRLY
ncbi:MAG: hypothetical protein Q9191_007351 [Dirinaria sp. TL-2023a]